MFKTLLDWCIVGPMINQTKADKFGCNRIMLASADTVKPGRHYFAVPTKVRETSIEKMLKKIYEHDFVEPESQYSVNNKIKLNYDTLSKNDKRFLELMEREAVKIDGHYQLPLPLKDKELVLPDNRMAAMKLMQSLKKRFERDEPFYSQYKCFMDELKDKKYARKRDCAGIEGRTWYVPHQGVLNPNKGKIRVVFDCSSQYKGNSINQNLLSGPDLTNQLIGVLHKFRLEPVAFMADMQAMYNQVKVPESQRSCLRYLWRKESDINSEIVDHEMCVHLFGAVSSPSSSNYALKRTAVDNSSSFGVDASETVMKNFYVDDLLKSVKSEEYAVDLIKRVKEMCAAGGFNLTKFICNRKNVLMSIDKRKDVKDTDLAKEELPTERALGVYWNVQEDALCFKVNLKEKPRNQRDMLSMLSSFYDPLGLVSPSILRGRLILQELCQEGLHWDKQVSEEYVKKWEAWKRELYDLEKLSLGSCIKPSNFRKIVNISLHNFSDASEIGYGQCSYLRVVDENENIQCSLIMGKAKVAPKKFVSIPKLELVAAVLSVKTSNMIKKELQLQQLDEYFWTDSRVVLGYIANDTKAFKTFVVKRVHMIQENSNV